MCLKKVDDVTKTGTGIGYKVFSMEGGHLYPKFQGKRRKYRVNVWYKDTNTEPIKARDGKSYEPGYHLFRDNHSDGHLFKFEECRKILYQDVCASGKLLRVTVLVAKKMLILPLRNKKRRKCRIV